MQIDEVQYAQGRGHLLADPPGELLLGHEAVEDDDVRCAPGDEGIEGVITGRALYDGRLDLKAALAVAQAAA